MFPVTMFDLHLRPQPPNGISQVRTIFRCLHYQMKNGSRSNTYITESWHFNCGIYSNWFKYGARKDRYRANWINRL